MMLTISTVAIIGSFRRYYELVCKVHSLFTDVGLNVTSPKGDPIIQENIPFVRFSSDAASDSDPLVQTIALHRILRADFTYVVAPNGYIGRTTSYEIGRIVQSKKPIYFSDPPADLPIAIPPSHICHATRIIQMVRANTFHPEPLYLAPDSKHEELENDLLFGRYQLNQ